MSRSKTKSSAMLLKMQHHMPLDCRAPRASSLIYFKELICIPWPCTGSSWHETQPASTFKGLGSGPARLSHLAKEMAAQFRAKLSSHGMVLEVEIPGRYLLSWPSRYSVCSREALTTGSGCEELHEALEDGTSFG